MSIGNREYWLQRDERCEPLHEGDMVVVQHVVNLDWIYSAKVRQLRNSGNLIVGIDEELNSPANWKVRCKL